MKVKAAGSLIDEPLVGCCAFIHEAANGHNFFNSLFLRLRIFYSEAIVVLITDQIAHESKHVCVRPLEYIINEVQYEWRIVQKHFKEENEKEIMHSYVIILMEDFEQDQILDYLNQLKGFRTNRRRSS